MNGNNRSLQAELRTRPVATRQTTAPPTRIIRTAHVLPVDADLGPIGNAITERIAATKRRLLDGGLLQPVEWGIPGSPDVRGRNESLPTFMLDAFIEQRPALDRGTLSTDRADNTVLVILDPLAITDEHLFRWGDPPHVYQIKAVEGIVQRSRQAASVISSEVTVIR